MDPGRVIKYISKCWLYYRAAQNLVFDYVISKFNKIVPRRYRFMKYKPVLIALFVIGISVQLFIFDNLNYNKLTTPTPSLTIPNKPVFSDGNKTSNTSKLKIPSEAEFRMNWVKNKLDRIAKHSQRWEITKFLHEVEPLPQPTNKVHIFYKAYFGSKEFDGKWKVWDQETVLSRIQEESNFHSKESPTHSPPTDIASSFYPILGCYSSRDHTVINTHFKQIRDTGIGVIAVSWYPPAHQWSTKDVLPLLLDAAGIYQLKISLHMETYNGRSIEDILTSIKFIIKNYSHHPSFYKMMKNGYNLPVFYVYDSSQLPAAEWRELFEPDGERSVRGTDYNAIFIGHLRDAQNRFEIQKSNFDGFYTYFASNAFTYGSTWKNWNTLSKFAEKHKLLFFPSVGPGYVDTNMRPWNSALTRHRARGNYYQALAPHYNKALHSMPAPARVFHRWSRRIPHCAAVLAQKVTKAIMGSALSVVFYIIGPTNLDSRGLFHKVAWRAALAAQSNGVSVTSFNNWLDGSQIEPARSASDAHFQYLDYEPEGPYFYLNLTRYWVKQFAIHTKDRGD